MAGARVRLADQLEPAFRQQPVPLVHREAVVVRLQAVASGRRDDNSCSSSPAPQPRSAMAGASPVRGRTWDSKNSQNASG